MSRRAEVKKLSPPEFCFCICIIITDITKLWLRVVCNTLIHAHTYSYTHIHTHPYTPTHTPTHTHICIPSQTHPHTHTHTYLYVFGFLVLFDYLSNPLFFWLFVSFVLFVFLLFLWHLNSHFLSFYFSIFHIVFFLLGAGCLSKFTQRLLQEYSNTPLA